MLQNIGAPFRIMGYSAEDALYAGLDLNRVARLWMGRSRLRRQDGTKYNEGKGGEIVLAPVRVRQP